MLSAENLSEGPTYDVEPIESGLKINLRGEIDLAVGPQLEELIPQLAAGHQRVVLDLSRVSFMDSTGIEVALRVRERLGFDGVSLMLVPAPPAYQRLFELTETDRFFTWQSEPA